jgi:hypothetical protein
MSSASQELVVVNEDPVSVTLGQPAVSGPDAAAFGLVANTCSGQSLASGEECSVTMIFRPARTGAHAATLEVPVEGEPDASFSAELSGEGIQSLRLTPSLVDFGTVFLTRSQRELLVENVSGREISPLLARIEPFTGRFRIYRPPVPDVCGRTLAAGASCRVGATFIPLPGPTTEARLIFQSSGAEMGSVALRGTWAPRPAAAPIRFPTPDATSALRKRLRAALARLRGRSRAALLRRGLIVRGIVPPAQGALSLLVRGRRASPRKQDASRVARLVAVRRRLAVQPGQPATIRAHLTRRGRRTLTSGRPLILDVNLAFVARSDDRLSEAKGVLRVGRAPKAD